MLNNPDLIHIQAKTNVKRMSYSSLRSYLNNKQEFYKRYVVKEPMEKVPVGMAIGSAVHKGIELYLKGKDPHTAKDLLTFTLQPGQTIDYGEKGSLEEAISHIETALGWFHKLDNDWCGVESEEGWTVSLNGGVRVKGFVDVLEHGDDGTHIIDFKTVGALSYPVNMTYFIQALTYHMLAEAVGYDVSKVSFIEIKKKPQKNRDKETHENMIRYHVFDEITEEDISALQKLYELAYKEITEGWNYYLPNLFGPYTTMEDWEDWKARCTYLSGNSE